jgi:hypothetical protein
LGVSAPARKSPPADDIPAVNAPAEKSGGPSSTAALIWRKLGLIIAAKATRGSKKTY